MWRGIDRHTDTRRADACDQYTSRVAYTTHAKCKQYTKIFNCMKHLPHHYLNIDIRTLARIENDVDKRLLTKNV